ncbi:MAG: mechanosensitive ion channel [Xanthomonadaceae bacterium]|nr:mechanosensitive ion channel [Xanthomonadaceae bacterium]
MTNSPPPPVEEVVPVPESWTDVTEWLAWFWNLRVIRIGDADVMVSQIAVTFVLLVVGIWLASWISRRVRRRLMSSEVLDVSAATAVEKLLFYVLVVVIVMLALQTLQVPIGMFAFFGGAIAIGVGFGAQSIFNNFISGLILMFDRPIRLGDTVEVSGNYGRIAAIGARCTRLRRFDGVDVLVPNSSLIENDVINWTLADTRVRQAVHVGVAYGSDVRRAADLMMQAAAEHPEVLKEEGRVPQVIFEEFGDNALELDLYFWLELSELVNMRIIRSAIRFRIDELFREAGISIAFPQRDVHLDTAKPLEIRMLP